MESTDQELLDAVVTPYNLTDEQEKKEIVRHYRALLRTLRTKLKKGDRELEPHLKWLLKRIKQCVVKVASLISYTLLQ
jgi:transcription termination factor NusB